MSSHEQSLFQQALVLHQAGNLAQARALYTRIVQRRPNHADALHLLGVIAYQAGDHRKAIHLIGRAIRFAPNTAAYHSNMGLAREAQNDLNGALASYDQAVALRPDFVEAYNNRGGVLYALGRAEDAIASYNQSIKLNPNDPAAYFNVGVVLAESRQPAAALANYERAIALAPGYAQAHANRGVALQSLGRLEDALASYDKALALQPDDPKIHANRGHVLQALGQPEAAVASCDKAIAHAPDAADAYMNRGRALRDLGRTAEAMEDFTKAAQLAPHDPDAQQGLFWLHLAPLENLHLIEKSGAEAVALHNARACAELAAVRAMTDFQVLHDMEQTAYLLDQGYDGDGLQTAHQRLQDIYRRLDPSVAADLTGEEIPLSPDEVADLNRFRQTLLRYQVADLGESVLNPDHDWQAIEDRYFGSRPEIIHIDGLLSPVALAELQRFCLVSTVWKKTYDNQYLGAFAHEGFFSPLHYRIAVELRQKMPRIFGDHTLEQLWSFKYMGTSTAGVDIHADFANVNLNFWVMPDDANLDPESGGIIVYDVPAPATWNFRDYNADNARIEAFLREHHAGSVKIPYRCNRAALFNSNLFHKTDTIRFKDGYENHRLNITYLFGRGLRVG